MSTPTPTDTRTGKPINLGFLEGRYSDLSSLGKGGMGQVLKAYDTTLAKWVAIKLLHGVSDNQEQVVRFQNEAKAASKLKHPNIVTVMDFGKSPEDQLYLVMEMVEGRSLSLHLEEMGRLPVPEALKLCISICDGLEHAHAQGIVHRDLKPSNIVISESGSPKIVDFGIAKLPSEEDDQELTKTGVIMGSPLYMSPEQARGDLIDHRSDLYSVGCILFRMLTGRPPFEKSNAMETMFSQMEDVPPKLSDLIDVNGFPFELEHAVERLLSKDRNERYGSAAELKYKLIDIELELDQDKDDSGEHGLKEKQTEDRKSASFILNDDDLLTSSEQKGMSGLQVAVLSMLGLMACFAIVFGINFMLDKGLDSSKRVKLDTSTQVKDETEILDEPRISKRTCTIRLYDEAQLKSYRKRFNHPEITSFAFEKCQIGDALKDYVSLNPHVLSFKSCDITDSSLIYLRQMKDLNYVGFDSADKITRKGYENLLYLPRLKSLAFKNMDASKIDLAVLKKLKNITFISLLGTNNTSDQFWEVLASYPELGVVRLGEISYDTYDFSKLKKLPGLHKLVLRPIYGMTPEKKKALAKKFPGVEFEFNSPRVEKILKMGDYKD